MTSDPGSGSERDKVDEFIKEFVGGLLRASMGERYDQIIAVADLINAKVRMADGHRELIKLAGDAVPEEFWQGLIAFVAKKLSRADVALYMRLTNLDADGILVAECAAEVGYKLGYATAIDDLLKERINI